MYKNSAFKEEDCKVYADCMRDAMCKVSGLPKSSKKHKDKVVYLKTLREGLKIPTNEEIEGKN